MSYRIASPMTSTNTDGSTTSACSENVAVVAACSSRLPDRESFKLARDTLNDSTASLHLKKLLYDMFQHWEGQYVILDELVITQRALINGLKNGDATTRTPFPQHLHTEFSIDPSKGCTLTDGRSIKPWDLDASFAFARRVLDGSNALADDKSALTTIFRYWEWEQETLRRRYRDQSLSNNDLERIVKSYKVLAELRNLIDNDEDEFTDSDTQLANEKKLNGRLKKQIINAESLFAIKVQERDAFYLILLGAMIVRFEQLARINNHRVAEKDATVAALKTQLANEQEALEELRAGGWRLFDEVRRSEQQLADHDATIAALKIQLANEQEALKESTAEGWRLFNEVRRSERQLADCEKELARKVTQLSGKEDQRASLQKQLTARRTELAERNKQIQVLQSRLADCRSSLAEKGTELSDQHAIFRERCSQHATTLIEKFEKIDALKSQLADSHSRFMTKETELTERDNQLRALKSELADFFSRFTEMETELAEWKNRIPAIKSQLEASQSRLMTKEAELAGRDEYVQALESQLAGLRRRLREKATELKDKDVGQLDKDAQLERKNEDLAQIRIRLQRQMDQIEAWRAEVARTNKVRYDERDKAAFGLRETANRNGADHPRYFFPGGLFGIGSYEEVLVRYPYPFLPPTSPDAN